MEVHAHAHTARKRWTHYLWEFVMLFLAVFCGFLAEYQLEHMIERDKEKEYIVSMVEDLKNDSTNISRSINYCKNQLEGFDSLLRNIYHKPYTDSSLRTLYYLKEKYTLVSFKARFSRGTISQLKNSGGFRLIRKRAASDSIVKYDLITERVEGQGEAVDFSGQQLLAVSVKIFDSQLVFEQSSKDEDILHATEKFDLITYDDKLVKEYANLAKFKRDVIRNYIIQLTGLNNRIPGFINFLKKEYHLE